MSAHKPKLPLAEEAITVPAGHFLQKVPFIAALFGVVGIAATMVLGPNQAPVVYYGSYLVSFMFFLSIALGGLFFVLIHFAARAGWSVVVRRFSEVVMGTFPILLLLTIPLLIGGHHNGVHTIYHHWMDPKLAATLKSKVLFLNEPFFFIRAALYFSFWILCSQWFLRNSVKQDTVGGLEISKKLQFWSPVSILAFALTSTFASFDWIMSIDPHWYSTMFGVYFFAGSLLSIYCTLALLSIGLRSMGFLKGIVTAEHDQDVGKMMFGFVVFWSYIAFSQFMLIWYANIPEETLWYSYRMKGHWLNLSIALIIGHFLIPFFFIMSKHVKRNPIAFGLASLWILVFHFLDLYWLIMPTLYHNTLHSAHKASFATKDLLLLVTSFVGIGGFFLASVTWGLTRNSLVPKKDPRLAESLSFENT